MTKLRKIPKQIEKILDKYTAKEIINIIKAHEERLEIQNKRRKKMMASFSTKKN